jgi:hypothetical protein
MSISGAPGTSVSVATVVDVLSGLIVVDELGLYAAGVVITSVAEYETESSIIHASTS